MGTIQRPLRSRPVGPLAATVAPRMQSPDLSSAIFIAMFAAMPVSFLFPSRILIALPATLLAGLLILLNLKAAKNRSWTIGFAPVLAVTGFLATASWVANVQEELASAAYLGGYFSVFVVYLAVRLQQPTVEDCHRAFVAFSVTAMVSLTIGVRVFHSTVGVPSLSSLMAARFLKEQIEPYQQVTWGNVNNTATFLVQIMPLFLAPLLDTTRSRKIRCWFLGCAIICGLNMLIVGSRAAFLVFPVYLTAILYYSRSMGNKTTVLTILGMVAAVIIYLNGDDGRFWEYLGQATSIQNGDASIMERLDSIIEGWGVMWEHPILGVGPGCAAYHVSYFAAHQMSVNHGVEYGIPGMLANIALIVQVCFRLVSALQSRLKGRVARLEFMALLSAFSFLLIGSIANAAISLGATNPWATTLAATLGLADCYRSSARPRYFAQPHGSIMALHRRKLRSC